MGDGDRGSHPPEPDPPEPPAWMKRDRGDEPYKLRRDPEFHPNDLKSRAGTSRSPQKDRSDHHAESTQRTSPHSGWRALVSRPLPLETETAVYIFISAIDLFITWMMLRSGNFRERNPVARYFLDHWGPKGMIYYKFGVVAIVTVAAQGIALRKPATARFVLILGSVVSGGVVVYSIALFLRGASS